MKFDILGRLENMDLPDGKMAVLYSVYEAVSNSVHAIGERFGDDDAEKLGKIEVNIDIDDDEDVKSIVVKDNGIGFNPDNLMSFETSDSRYKYQRGGKGVGRFVWIKTFRNIKVYSKYEDEGILRSIKFDFDPERSDSIINKKEKLEKEGFPGSKIEISGPRNYQGGKINHATFMKDLALHFFKQYIDGTLPNIDVVYNSESRNLQDFISGKIKSKIRRTITSDISEEKWSLTFDHIYVDRSISTELRNSYLLTAHGRLVGEPQSVEKKYDLSHLGNNQAYVAIVSGTPLDSRVDQQRMSFRFNDHQKNDLEDAILKEIESYLEAHISKVRGKQKETVRRVLEEHPQLSSEIGDLDIYVSGLYPGMDEEQIGGNLFTLLFRKERKLRRQIDKLRVSGEPDGSDSSGAVSNILNALIDQEKLRLSDLVAKRHQILEAASLLLKYKDHETKSHHYEEMIHELICPMGRMYASGDYDNHNLWIIDESLSGYQLIASDKSISSLVGKGSSSKEPDLIFFNPFGFRRPNSNDPITIIEFKRPGDKRPSSHPIDQTLTYIEKLRNHSVKGIDGDTICDIGNDTPFNVFVVCELMKETRDLLERSAICNNTPDGEGYYGWAPRHNAVVQVISFKKMISDAIVRNRAFFDALGLKDPVETAAKKAAQVRSGAA